jgi:hypothetical protein
MCVIKDISSSIHHHWVAVCVQVWWWVPQGSVQEFKRYAEGMTEGGRKELYTKSISPFLQDRDENPPEPTLPLRVCPCCLGCVGVPS